MNGPGYPYYYPPPRPPKRGLPPVVIVLLAVGGAFAVGGGACVVLGGLAVLGASADSEPAVAEGETPAIPTATAAPTATTLTETGADPPPATIDTAGGAEPPPLPGTRPPATGTGAGGTWRCTASGSVRVCGFANVCNNQMVFGNGFGKDRYLASTQAKNACEGMARAKGGSTVCVVQCTAR